MYLLSISILSISACFWQAVSFCASLVKKGMTNREIGEELCTSEATVKKHLPHRPFGRSL